MLAEARAVDVDVDGVHREPIEDGGGEGGVAEVLAPVAERDVGGDRGGDVAVPTIDEVVERVRGGRLVGPALDLAEAYVINDQECVTAPRW